jgi:hypothetical protein
MTSIARPRARPREAQFCDGQAVGDMATKWAALSG